MNEDELLKIIIEAEKEFKNKIITQREKTKPKIISAIINEIPQESLDMRLQGWDYFTFKINELDFYYCGKCDSFIEGKTYGEVISITHHPTTCVHTFLPRIITRGNYCSVCDNYLSY